MILSHACCWVILLCIWNLYFFLLFFFQLNNVWRKIIGAWDNYPLNWLGHKRVKSSVNDSLCNSNSSINNVTILTNKTVENLLLQRLPFFKTVILFEDLLVKKYSEQLRFWIIFNGTATVYNSLYLNIIRAFALFLAFSLNLRLLGQVVNVIICNIFLTQLVLCVEWL